MAELLLQEETTSLQSESPLQEEPPFLNENSSQNEGPAEETLLQTETSTQSENSTQNESPVQVTPLQSEPLLPRPESPVRKELPPQTENIILQRKDAREVQLDLLFNGLTNRRTIPAHMDKPLHTFLEWLLDDEMLLVGSFIEVLGVSELDKAAGALVTVFEYIGETPALLTEAMSREVSKTGDPNTLFRGNSMASRMMTLYSRRIGEQYLQNSIRPIVEKICSSEHPFEIDPTKLAPGENLQQNLANLLQTTLELIDVLANSINQVPLLLRQLCTLLKEEVGKLFPNHTKVAIGGFIILRFINPVIVSPDSMFTDLKITPKNRRKLILVSKILQNLANQTQFGEKEPFMKETNNFILEQRAKMDTFLENLGISTPLQKAEVVDEPVRLDEELPRAFNVLCFNVYFSLAKIKAFLIEEKKPSSKSIIENIEQVVSKLGKEPFPSNEKPKQATANIDEQERLYVEYLEKAKREDFTEFKNLGAIYSAGLDSRGRPIVVFSAEKMNVKNMDMDKFFLYILLFMDPIVASEYVLVYLHTNLDASHRPTFPWLRTAYGVFNRRFKKNVKQVYIVQPSRWLKLLVNCFRLLLSNKFWKKLVYVDTLQDLQNQHKISFRPPS